MCSLSLMAYIPSKRIPFVTQNSLVCVCACLRKGHKCACFDSGCTLHAMSILEGNCQIVSSSPWYFPLSSSSPFSFLYSVLSQQPDGTVSQPFFVCTAKCFYPLASGYVFLSLESFYFPSHIILPFLGLCSSDILQRFTRFQSIKTCWRNSWHSGNGLACLLLCCLIHGAYVFYSLFSNKISTLQVNI